MVNCIVILEDHPLYAAGLKEVAEQLLPGSTIVWEPTLRAGLLAIRQHNPALIISDLHLPDASGLNTLTTLQQHAPESLLVGITGDVQLLDQQTESVRTGDGRVLILAKTESVDCVFDSIVMQIQMQTAANECDIRTQRPNVWTAHTPDRHLTRKQQAVLSLMGQGLSNKEIARKLQISPETVKSHAKSLYRQLGVKNRTQAAGQIRRLIRA